MYKPELLKNDKYKKVLFASLIIGLLLLRFPLIIIPSFVDTGMSSMTINIIFQDGTYLLTAIIMVLERDRLAQFKFNTFAIVIFILAPILRMTAYLFLNYQVMTSKIWELWFPLCISGLLIIFFAFNYKKLQKDNFKYYAKWIVISIFVGAVGCIGISSIYNLVDPTPRSSMSPTFSIFLGGFFFQLSYAAVNEEPLFRGLIWGLLEKKGWKQYWIWLFQAGLFCVGHIFYLPKHPINFIGTFIYALILGLLVWRSKSTGTSMIAHGTINSLGNLVMHYTW